MGYPGYLSRTAENAQYYRLTRIIVEIEQNLFVKNLFIQNERKGGSKGNN